MEFITYTFMIGGFVGILLYGLIIAGSCLADKLTERHERRLALEKEIAALKRENIRLSRVNEALRDFAHKEA